MIYGANGYTGGLIAREASRRGLRPVLAGRRSEAIGPLAAELGCPSRVFSLESGDLAAQLAGCQVLLNCAGPFARTAAPLVEACLAARVHYLDITGEIDCIEQAAALDRRAAEQGVSLIPAVGFDVVPTDCLAALLAARLPAAMRLQLAFRARRQISPGTMQTVLEQLPRGGRVRIDGRIERVPFAWKTFEVPFPNGPRAAMTVAWGDVASAYYSTGIPNIEVYMALPPRQIAWLRRLRGLVPLAGLPPVQHALRWWARSKEGPTETQRAQARASIWARVQDPQGRSIEGTLQTPGGYTLTVLTALAAVERVRQAARPGFATPSRAFSADFILQFPEVDLRLPAAGSPKH